jgi:YD repeat-containing protein
VAIYQDTTVVKTIDAKFLPSAVSVDLSGFESNGKIVETYADGSTATTVMEFDANGKPTKITDSNGNVTVLTW